MSWPGGDTLRYGDSSRRFVLPVAGNFSTLKHCMVKALWTSSEQAALSQHHREKVILKAGTKKYFGTGSENGGGGTKGDRKGDKNKDRSRDKNRNKDKGGGGGGEEEASR